MFLFKSNVYCSVTNNVGNKLDVVIAVNKQQNIEEYIPPNNRPTLDVLRPNSK